LFRNGEFASEAETDGIGDEMQKYSVLANRVESIVSLNPFGDNRFLFSVRLFISLFMGKKEGPLSEAFLYSIN